MTTIDSSMPMPASLPGAPHRVLSGGAHFVGHSRQFWGIVLRAMPLMLVTLGVYRFWLTTDIRRFLWSNTQVAGENFEYVGTARELLLGFLFAIAVLVPLYVAFFAASLAPGLGPLAQFMSVVAGLLLWVLGQFAIFRARRYRLTRTVYRGVRFTQTGSGFAYALYASLWMLLAFVTLGLAYPFALAALERYKMRRTFFGNLPGRFEGSGLGLFAPVLGLWLLIVAPPLAVLAVAVARVDFGKIGGLIEAIDLDLEDNSEAARLLLSMFPDADKFGPALAASFFASMLLALLLYPVLRAIVLRWWVSGVRFGNITAISHLRTGAVYGTYATFFG